MKSEESESGARTSGEQMTRALEEIALSDPPTQIKDPIQWQRDIRREEQHFEYDRESDVLDVYFGPKRRAWTIELTDNIAISVDREGKAPIALGFLNFTELIQPTPFGPRSFPITGLADLPIAERDLVLEILNSSPVDAWLDVSAVQTMPDSPFAVAHLERPPRRILELVA